MGASIQASALLRIHTGMDGHTMRANYVKQGRGQMFHSKCSGTGHKQRERRRWIKCKRVTKSPKTRKNVKWASVSRFAVANRVERVRSGPKCRQTETKEDDKKRRAFIDG